MYTTTEKLDVEPSGFQLFIDLLHTRATDLGMLHDEGNGMIPIDPTNLLAVTPINSITDYGWMAMAQIHAWESTFIALQT